MFESPKVPFVSIIMPIKNEEKYIERSLGAVLAQDYPADRMEVLIADGNSSDRTREMITRMTSSAEFPITILENPTGIVPKALNMCLRHAKGDVIIRVDGHCEIQKNYVSTCVDQLLSSGVECVGGSIVTIGDTLMAEMIALAMSTAFGVGNVAFRVDTRTSQLTDSVPFPAYPKRIFDEIGYFDEEMLCNEDDEFNYRILKKKGQILLVHELRTRYFGRGSLSSLWRQYFRYGFWKVRVMQKHPGQMKLRHFIPSLFVMAIAASAIFAWLVPWGWVVLASLLGVYLLAVMVASIRSTQNSTQRLLLPVVFMVIHVGYGTGFLSGLARFWNRWGK